MHLRPLVILAALLILPVGAADPGGVDAPGESGSAIDVPIDQDIEGSLGGEDRADWYRVTGPPSKGLRVTITLVGAEDAHVEAELQDDEGRTLDVDYPRRGGSTMMVEGHTLGAYRIGIASWFSGSPEVTYVMQLATIDAPDLEIVNVTVEPVPAPILGHDLDNVRRVTVDIANIGSVAATGALDVWAWSDASLDSGYGSGCRNSEGLMLTTFADPVGCSDVTLAPGEATTVSFLWRAPPTMVGDVTFCASIYASNDMEGTNDWGCTRHYAYVPVGLGTWWG